ncbi:MAG: hypothetical protein EB051_01570 [Chlamydiia bacterium]|nr:hypothetical protein [Chlamydiia bacterium]
MKNILFLSAAVLLFCNCTKQSIDSNTVVSMQIVDRNGFTETISAQDRIKQYQQTNFLEPQPFQKVLRVYGKSKEGKSHSILTSYHQNGHIWQSLHVVDGRAHGTYQEWHSNGQLKMELQVIEGFADLEESAQRTWVFEGKNAIWDSQGHLIAEITYAKGLLHHPSIYYHTNGKIHKIIPYLNNNIEGEVVVYDEAGNTLESIFFIESKRHGKATGYFSNLSIQYEERYENDLLIEGSYYDPYGACQSTILEGSGFRPFFLQDKLSSLEEFQNGKAKGRVELFNPHGIKTGFYHQNEGKKEGLEVLYYTSDSKAIRSEQMKLSLKWHDDLLQGEVKTWYENGVLESQREFHQNEKHGVCLAWYPTGELMLMEEYENNKLIKGSYFKKGDKKAVSRIERGNGIATLYSPDGTFLIKTQYEKGNPITDPSS